MISYKEFEVIRSILQKDVIYNELASYVYTKKEYYVFKSLSEVEEILVSLENKGYVVKGGVTEQALEELSPLKVDNAVILAAGGFDISAKSVYSMPKGLFVKNNETLIERQIRQLQEAGIKDITVVVGYKQEMYFFLQEKWGVNLVVNPNLNKNNVYSLYIAKDILSNTYICNSDNYFKENPFFEYEYSAYHATVFKEDSQNELLVRKNLSGRILEVYSDSRGGECIYGHAYVDRRFSNRMKQFLEDEIDDFRVGPLFWEEFVSKHINNLDMYVREYSPDFVFEFDSIQEIQNIDSLFLESVSGEIKTKISQVLKCNEKDIKNINILQEGLTNVLFTFDVRKEKYIFRYPGESSSFFISRENEVKAQKLVAESGVDNTYVYIDESGIKISKFIEKAESLDDVYYKDIELMKSLAEKIRKFHDQGANLIDWQEYHYNPLEEAERLMREASKMKTNLFKLFEEEWKAIHQLFEYTERDGIAKTMCHNDINQDNLLVTENSFDLIDWEFAGWNDPAYDFGRVIAGYDLDDPAIDSILEAYFRRPPTEIERLHWIAYMGIHNWYYMGWALYKESINESSRDWMLFFYKQTKRVIDYALPKYELVYDK